MYSCQHDTWEYPRNKNHESFLQLDQNVLSKLWSFCLVPVKFIVGNASLEQLKVGMSLMSFAIQRCKNTLLYYETIIVSYVRGGLITFKLPPSLLLHFSFPDFLRSGIIILIMWTGVWHRLKRLAWSQKVSLFLGSESWIRTDIQRYPGKCSYS